VSASHIIFIPRMVMVGMFLGFILGARPRANQFEPPAEAPEAEREYARRARGRPAKPPGTDKPGAADLIRGGQFRKGAGTPCRLLVARITDKSHRGRGGERSTGRPTR